MSRPLLIALPGNAQMADKLATLMGGETVGAALIQLLAEPTTEAETLQADLQSWFREWSAAPLFAELIRDDKTIKS